VFEAFTEILINHTLSDSIDLIFGEMSFYVKTRVLKWEKNQLEKVIGGVTILEPSYNSSNKTKSNVKTN
jgi:hypothetical protein